MKRLAILLILALFLIGCGAQEQTRTVKVDTDNIKTRETVCNKPYYEYKAGQCCLDKNANKVCDNDEETEEVVSETIIESKKAPDEEVKVISAKVEKCSDFCSGRVEFDRCFDECAVTCGTTVRLSNSPGDYACAFDGPRAKVRLRSRGIDVMDGVIFYLVDHNANKIGYYLDKTGLEAGEGHMYLVGFLTRSVKNYVKIEARPVIEKDGSLRVCKDNKVDILMKDCER